MEPERDEGIRAARAIAEAAELLAVSAKREGT